MRHLKLVFFRREDLVDLLEGTHTRTGQCIEITHIDEKIARAVVISSARGYEQLFLTLRIQPAA